MAYQPARFGSLAGEQVGDVFGERAVCGLLEGSVVVHVDVGALSRHPKAGPQFLGLVRDVINGTGSRALDELGESCWICETGYTNDGDLVSELFLYLCDRRGFSASKWSPGGPIPEHHILALVVGKVDCFTRDGRELARKQGVRGYWGIADSFRGSFSGCRS